MPTRRSSSRCWSTRSAASRARNSRCAIRHPTGAGTYVACIPPMTASIFAQHQSLDHALLALDELLDQRWDGHRLEASVAGLAMIMQAHFEHEERSYLFTDFV